MFAKRGLVAMLSMVVTLLAATPGLAVDWIHLNDQALAKLDFEGMSLPTTVQLLKREFPDARRTAEQIDEEIGLECYQVGELKDADVARFYYCDGELYQFEVEYNLPRVEQLGGMRAILQKLVDVWGPVDHAGESRWTWQRPRYHRRADLYVWPTSVQLTLTDMSYIPIVSRRIQKQDEKRRLNLGV